MAQRFMFSADGAPNACCADIRRQALAADLPPVVAAHMDAVAERLTHMAASADDRPRTTTVVVTIGEGGAFGFSFASDPITDDE